jgi:(p)ppGpp synthase/HD superfamily hydrolase
MYSERVQLALTTMLEAHGVRHRKAGGGYEAAHTTSVAMIVGDYGFDEDTVIAALLHDTLEDTELAPSVIRTRFGDHVLAMVEDVSEPPKPARWRDRKLTYIEQLRVTARDGSLAVASADKIHNLSNMVSGLRAEGVVFASAFTAGLDAMMWYQRAVYDMLGSRWTHPMLDEHGQRLEAFRAAAAEVSQTPR